MVPSSSSAHSTLLGHSWGRKKPILPECGKGSRGGISCARKKTFVKIKKYFFSLSLPGKRRDTCDLSEGRKDGEIMKTNPPGKRTQNRFATNSNYDTHIHRS